MRQPQVARLLTLLLAAVLLAPLLRTGWSLLLTGAFLVEFLTQGQRPLLSRLTSPPVRSALAVPGVAADRHAPTGGWASPRPLVLVHGATPEGKDDPRARQAAELLARLGFEVALPTIEGLARGRLRPHDVEPVVATIAARPGPTVVVAVSVGAGPALLAAADPRVRLRVTDVLTLGGYARADELIRFYLTGEYAWGDVRGRTVHEPALVRAFLEANADLLDESARRLLRAEAGPPLTAALAGLSPDLRRLLDALSPERVAADIRARLILVHGRADPAVPFTETLRLAAARPARTRVVLVGLVQHVEGLPLAPGRRGVSELLSLWMALYGLVAADKGG